MTDFDEDTVQHIWAEFGMETDANRKMAENHQRMFEQTIGNLSALKLLNEDDTRQLESAVKNS